MKWLRGLAATFAGTTAALVSFCLLVWATRAVLFLRLGSHNPNDASVGDSAGWGLVFLSPVLGPPYLIVCLVLGAFAFRAVYRRL
jgi:hypothetical protein